MTRDATRVTTHVACAVKLYVFLVSICTSNAYVHSDPGISTPREYVSASSGRSLLVQQGVTVSANVCGQTEYYCGAGDVFDGNLHAALGNPGDCVLDAGTDTFLPFTTM